MAWKVVLAVWEGALVGVKGQLPGVRSLLSQEGNSGYQV